MNAIIAPPRVTPEDLLAMPDGERFELVDGNLVKRPMSIQSSYVGGEINFLLHNFCRSNPCGWVFPDGTGYQCYPDAPERVRRPDGSFIRLERMSLEDYLKKGYIRVWPDLAIEIVSPNDLAEEIEEKVTEYLHAGVSLVWVVYPKSRYVQVRRADGADSILHEADELTGENVLPGFRCLVSDLFRLPPGVSPG